MNLVEIILAFLVMQLIFGLVLLILKVGFKTIFKTMWFTIKSPKKAFKKFKETRVVKQRIKENRAYWNVGQTFDKLDALARYKKDERVLNHPSVKIFSAKRRAKIAKLEFKSNKKIAKSKTSKEFNKVVK